MGILSIIALPTYIGWTIVGAIQLVSLFIGQAIGILIGNRTYKSYIERTQGNTEANNHYATDIESGLFGTNVSEAPAPLPETDAQPESDTVPLIS